MEIELSQHDAKLWIPNHIDKLETIYDELIDKDLFETMRDLKLHSKEEINYMARIVSVCDIFEAYVAERVYHPHRTYKEGIQYLLYLSHKGKIDREFTKFFIRMLLD